MPRLAGQSRLARLIAIGVAALVAIAGLAYAVGRSPQYESSAMLVLAPATSNTDEATNIIESIERSGTIGTHVELLASADTLRRAGSPNVSVLVRAIPDSRVISVATRGGEGVVQPGLTAVLRAAAQLEPQLGDPWTQKVLQQPSAPARVGAPTLYVLVATLVLALLAALAVMVLFRRVAGPGDGDGDGALRDPWDQGIEGEVLPAPRSTAVR